eukprot:TRINITY_DN6005_c0_g1_i2.p1 TRINITY_DN6005_c0_g1~~TRINITY_DN6005_c0_g1_i2.p1  ORF type:complete len:303 (+),score=71.28 TRINITY_DN6005_c0_g1_i2:114-911(+)
MKDFKSQKIDTLGTIARVKQLFHGHPELILGFNTFLPPGFKIEAKDLEAGSGTTMPSPIASQDVRATPPTRLQDEQSNAPGFDTAVGYVSKIKARFVKQPEVYQAFLAILHAYQKGKSLVEVHKEVSVLFASHQDLMAEFEQFLPNKPELSHKLSRQQDSEPTTGNSEVTAREAVLFHRVKQALSPQAYAEFMKCIDLYNQHFATRQETLSMVTALLNGHGTSPELLGSVRVWLGFEETDSVPSPSMSVQTDTDLGSRLSQMNLK